MDVPYDLNKVKKGEKNEFRSFFECFYPKLMALACRFVDSQVAEDLVQDVFASYWEKKYQIEVVDIHSFLFKCLQNSCLNHIKHQMVVQDYAERVRIAEARLEVMGKSEEQSDVLRHILSQDLRELVEKSISKLSPKCAEAFRLYYFVDLSRKEIGERLQVSNRTVEGYIRQALLLLRDELRPIFFLVFML